MWLDWIWGGCGALAEECTFLSDILVLNVLLTKQLDPSGEAVDVYESPQGFGDVHAAEEQHGAGVVDPVKHAALLVHPEGDDVSLVGELLGQSLGPEAALGHQVGAGVLGQGVWVDPRRVFAREAKPQGAAPAALLFGDLERTHLESVMMISLYFLFIVWTIS